MTGMDFFELHHGELPFVLPNAWDVASALALADAGFPAVGTTSLGVAAAYGLVDAGGGTRAATIDLARRLRELPVLLTVDLEDGLSDDPDEVADLVASLDVAGVNLEDSTRGALVAPQGHAAKVTAVKRRCPDVFVNARVDTFWLGTDATVDATLVRAESYVDAGADGVFVPGNLDLEQIAAITGRVPVPVNVLASPRHTRTELGEHGVRRISTGSLLYRAALQQGVDVARAVRDGRLAPTVISYGDVQALSEAYVSRAR